MFAIYKRETGSYFTSPVGYIVIAAFMVFNGVFFYTNCLYSGMSNMTNVFHSMFYILMFIIPLVTMRLFSEDKRNKTDQALLTSPVGIPSVVFAKYLSALTILLCCLMGYVADGIIISFFASPDWGVILGNIISSLLIGSAFISIGVFVSSLTESVIVAAIVSFAINAFISMIDNITSTIPWNWLKDILMSVSFQQKSDTFSLGLVALSDVIFFLSISFMFLFFTDRIIDRRRWA